MEHKQRADEEEDDEAPGAQQRGDRVPDVDHVRVHALGPQHYHIRGDAQTERGADDGNGNKGEKIRVIAHSDASTGPRAYETHFRLEMQHIT